MPQTSKTLIFMAWRQSALLIWVFIMPVIIAEVMVDINLFFIIIMSVFGHSFEQGFFVFFVNVAIISLPWLWHLLSPASLLIVNQYQLNQLLINQILQQKVNQHMFIIKLNTCQRLQQQTIRIEKLMIIKQNKSEQRNIGESYPRKMEQNLMGQKGEDQQKVKPQGNTIRQYIRQLKRYSILVLILLSMIMYISYVLYHFVGYLVVSSIAFNQPSNQENTAKLLSHLDVLCKFTPIFNDRFYQQYIYQLAQHSEYEKVVQKSDEALQYSYNKQKFSIHYHKALALCLLQNFIKCKEAADKALIFATKQKFPQVKYIYNILVSNNVISHEKVPTGAQLYYFEQQQSGQAKKSGGQEILSTL